MHDIRLEFVIYLSIDIRPPLYLSSHNTLLYIFFEFFGIKFPVLLKFFKCSVIKYVYHNMQLQGNIALFSEHSVIYYYLNAVKMPSKCSICLIPADIKYHEARKTLTIAIQRFVPAPTETSNSLYLHISEQWIWHQIKRICQISCWRCVQ